ncbi:OprO/OprP family phosphate-selective porin [Aliifodinibius salicampi]|uniref:OprO/OprP family phosphate-selective porin n=1 Tax=Fodinibius salicampi TaxID=1920655 RepID=A0ABT3Q0N5_9BACT|nr:porin [Fodinibius salicampi]MCW9713646.1 OprO/OprP family phosphate-selective porin [Fodinibius salicampi]
MHTLKYLLRHLFSVALFTFALTALSYAQEHKSQDGQLKQLQENLKNDYFSFGLLVQGLADFQPERMAGYNGFKASKGRFKISGIFDNQFGYNLQATMLKSPSILDANVYYKPTVNFSIKGGIFKSPFTHEYLTGAGSILFASRSTVVNQLGTKRQVGFQIDTYTSEKTFRFTGGIFNGNNYSGNSNDDNKFLYVGRIESYLGDDSNQTKLGVSIAHETKDAPGAGNLSTGYIGKQTLLTTYASLTQNKLLLDGEFIHGWRNPDVGPDSNPYGYYFTAGYLVTDSSRLLIRWDAFEGDNLTQDTEQILVGFNHTPNSFTKLKLNYVLPTNDSIEYSNFLAILQVGF